MNIDGVIGSEITDAKKLIIIHDIDSHQRHCVSFDTAKWILDVISRGVMNTTIECYTVEDPFEFLITECPCSNDGTVCDVVISISELYKKVYTQMVTNNNTYFRRIKSWIKSDFSKLQRRKQQLVILASNKNRECYKKEHDLTDCPNCIDADGIDGLGKKIPSRSNNPTTDVHQCQTCNSIYCIRCKALFDRYGRLDHTMISCAEYIEAKERFEGVKYIKCPGCNVDIYKNEGCNHITCICKVEFCYICGIKFKPDEGLSPFVHYDGNVKCKQHDYEYGIRNLVITRDGLPNLNFYPLDNFFLTIVF